MARTIQKVPKRQLVEEYLITHPFAANAEVAAACGVSERLISTARKDAVAKGLLEPAYMDRQSKPLDTEPSSPGSGHLPEQVQEYLKGLTGANGKPIETEEALSMLGTAIRQAYANKNFALFRDLVLADSRIRDKTADTNLTVPDPLTPEEFVKHTSDILDCIGPLLTAAALCHAFDVPNRLAFEEEYGRIKATRSPAETPGAKIDTATSSSKGTQIDGN